MSTSKSSVTEISLSHLNVRVQELLPQGAWDALYRAVGMARDVDTLNKWAAEDPGMRRWYMQPHVAGFVGCTLVDNRRDADGTDRSFYSKAHLEKVGCGWDTSWSREFGNPNANDIPRAAMRLAVQAIIDGKVYNK